MANAVAALYTSLTLESSQFIANAKRTATATEKMSNDISRSLTAAKSAVVGFVAAAGAGLAINGVKNALDYAAAIGETSQQLGIATKAYQELSYAATQSGVSTQELETGLARLTRNIGSGAKVFSELGISIKDATGNSRATGDVFNDIAAKLGKITDPAKRAAIEVALFGKTGQKLDTLLSGGTAALGAMADEAQRLGLVLSDKQIADADRAADTFAKVNFQLKTSFAGVVSDNAQALIGLANAFGKVVSAGSKAVNFIGRIGENIDLAQSKLALIDPFAGAGEKRGAQAKIDRINNGRLNQFNSLGAVSSLLNPVKAPSIGVDGPAEKIDKVSKAAKAATKPVYDFTAALEGMAKVDASIAGEGGALSIFATDEQIYSDTVSKLTTLGDMTSLIQPAELIDKEQLARVEKFGESLSSNLGTALVYGQNLGDALVNSLKAAAAEAISSGLFKLLTGGGSGTGGAIGSIVSSIFGGFRANGGPVSGGKAYVVGERGPEILTGATGRIIPNGAIGGGGGGQVINQTLSVSLAGNAATHSDLLAMGQATYAATLKAVKASRNSGIGAI